MLYGRHPRKPFTGGPRAWFGSESMAWWPYSTRMSVLLGESRRIIKHLADAGCISIVDSLAHCSLLSV